MLVGHSAGAHLGAMAILELLHDQRAHGAPHPTAASMHFHDSHYGRLRDPLEESSGSSESFAVVSDNGNNGEGGVERMDSNASSLDATLASMVEVSHGDVSPEPKQTDSAGEDDERGSAPKSETGAEAEPVWAGEGQGAGRRGKGEGTKPSVQGAGDADGEEESCEEEDDNDSVVTVRPKDIERHATLVDLCSTIKAFVGKCCTGQYTRHQLTGRCRLVCCVDNVQACLL